MLSILLVLVSFIVQTLLLSAFGANLTAASTCPCSSPSRNMYYEVHLTNVVRDEARRLCQARGGDLAKAETQEELIAATKEFYGKLAQEKNLRVCNFLKVENIICCLLLIFNY